MNANSSPQNSTLQLIMVGAAAWLVPGGGYFVLGDRTRALVVMVTVLITFLTGLYVGSIGVIDPVGNKPWYIAQVMNSPLVMLIGNHIERTQLTALQMRGKYSSDAIKEYEREHVYRVYGKAMEIGQIYTSIAGLLNLLCIVNAMYLAHSRGTYRTSPIGPPRKKVQ